MRSLVSPSVRMWSDRLVIAFDSSWVVKACWSCFFIWRCVFLRRRGLALRFFFLGSVIVLVSLGSIVFLFIYIKGGMYMVKWYDERGVGEGVPLGGEVGTDFSISVFVVVFKRSL